tara:strand:- start:12 stop:392 length:381 start_codon:yes stop_codon:yes gene_type:complete
MSQLNVDAIVNKEGTGSPTFTNGLVCSGVGTFSSQVSIAGTLTYEDVTNVDSVGIVTGRLGLRATAGGLHVQAGITTLVDVNVGSALTAVAIDGTGSVSVGSTNLLTEINTKATMGKAIAMAMVFG